MNSSDGHDFISEQNICDDTEMKEKDDVSFSHKELVNLTREAVNKIIESDPLLGVLAHDPTVEEVKAQAAVAQGQAITLYLNRGDLPRLSVVVPTHNTTVLDLKKAVMRHTNLALKRDKIIKKLSWKNVWKKYYLGFNNVKLTSDKDNIKEYGISNKMELCYVKRFREKNKAR